MSDILDILKKRYSVKKYSDDKVPSEVIDKVTEAGIYAPSGLNRQAVRLMVVEDRDTVREIADINASVGGFPQGMDPFYGAPVVIVVFADRGCSTHIEDGSIALANMLNEAFSLGVGSCWIHRARECFETQRGREIAREYGIPDEYIGIGNCILGYPAQGYEGKVKERVSGRVHRKEGDI